MTDYRHYEYYYEMQKDRRVILSFISAAVLALFGFIRFSSDMLTDANIGWYSMLEGTIFRYLMRAPSDGTFLGDLSVQYVKIISIPCAISGLFIVYRFIYHDLRDTDIRWHRAFTRILYIGMFLAAFTIMEIEKATHLFGFRMAGLLEGERAWLNHILHLISAIIGWFYMSWLKFIPQKDISYPK
ncbi:MAG: hypothetical protein HY762_06350 [Planctomycetes bacterium]|nr:hypothetical protein [Planctomycetota bacterium]